MSLLEVNNLSKDYQNFKLQDVSFELPEGYIMGYVGQNGAGKTTTINLITNLCHAKKGTVRIDGHTYQEDPQKYVNAIGYIGDESYFPKEFRLQDIRSLLKKFYKSFQLDKFDALCGNWNLPEKTKIRDYSRGMKVKLMFASVLSRETKLLILDEATNGLDPVMRAEILNILQKYIEDGNKSIFFSTHMLTDLEQIADYVVFIHQGKIMVNETKDDLLESWLLIRGSIKDLKPEMERRLIGVTRQAFGFEAIVATDDAAGFGHDFVLEKPSIDQIMLHQIKMEEK